MALCGDESRAWFGKGQMTSRIFQNIAPGQAGNALRFRDFMMRVIEDFTIFNDFSCGVPEAEDTDKFLHDDAGRYFEEGVAVTYGLFFDESSKARSARWHLPKGASRTPIGFATLQDDTLEIPGKKYSRHIPAVRIRRLGIRKMMQNKGLGSTFLFMIRKLFLSQPETQGAHRYLTLNTYPSLVHFYEKNNFIVLGGKPARPKPTEQLFMYLDSKAKSIHLIR